MKKIIVLLLMLLCASFQDDRIKELLEKMTFEEKVQQLLAAKSQAAKPAMKGDELNQVVEEVKTIIAGRGVGHLSATLRLFSLEESVEAANAWQRLAVEKSRFDIPLLIHDECSHGCMARGSTVFPVSIAMASTWSPDLIHDTAAAIGRETRERGIRQALSPTVNIAGDPRGGRTQETFGEDPYLASRMAAAFVKGIQSQGVAATPKHFVANYMAPGGRDSNAVHLGERYLREICFPAFKAAVVEAGALSLMAAYNSIDGVPCHGDYRLLQEILKKEWGFKGFVVSDYTGVLGLHTRHRVARNPAGAAKRALLSGVDVDLPDSPCYKLFKEGSIPEQALDDAVGRVLRVKFQLGLFDDPFTDDTEAVNSRGLAREVARQSMVLLKNEGNVLPLGVRSVAVIGPSADLPRLGDYSAEGADVVTPLMGIRERPVVVNHARGCEIAKITEPDREKRIGRGMAVPDDAYAGFPEAVDAARESDCAVLCLGNMRGTEGEARDRSDLDLPGVQEELIKEVAKVNDRVVVVLITGSAITMGEWIDDVEAVIMAWYPGVEGGNALADVLFGDFNPGGRLPITFPKRVGQLPLRYNHKPSGRLDDYVDLRGEQPLFPFGFGLSYTRFEYDHLEIEWNDTLKIGFLLRNAGERAGDEVAQLYIRKRYSAVARPVRELKRFQRIALAAGEERSVVFTLQKEDLESLDPRLRPMLEKGEYEIVVGASSADLRLTGNFHID